jgi:hypothetical protein
MHGIGQLTELVALTGFLLGMTEILLVLKE